MSNRVREWPALAAIAGLFAIAWLVVGAGASAPIIDDWVYAWSVEHLLASGRIRVLEFSAIYPIFQILWGAAFARIAGFSFVALRLSTVVLAVGGCWAVYMTGRELGCRISTSLLGAFALALHPVYFALSFSFMTEIPFVSLSALALYGYVRALRREDAVAGWLGACAAIAAFLVRPVAITLPVSFLLGACWTTGWRSTLRRYAPSIVATVVFMLACQAALPTLVGPLQWAAIREDQMRWWFMVSPASYARWTLNIVVVAVFPFTTLFVPSAFERRTWIHVTVATAIVAGVCRVALGALSAPLPDWQTWSLQEITARSLIGGDLQPSSWSVRVMPFVTLLGTITAGAFAALLVRIRHWRPGPPRPAIVLAAYAALQLAAIHALWLYNDRYYIVLTPALALAGACALDMNLGGQWIAAALLAGLAVVDATGTRDMLAFNYTCAQLAQDLESSGVAPSDIDAGYALNGWRLYAHPEHLPPGADPSTDVPYVTSKRVPPYQVVNSPPPGTEVLRVVPLEGATWQASHQLFVVHRR